MKRLFIILLLFLCLHSLLCAEDFFDYPYKWGTFTPEKINALIAAGADINAVKDYATVLMTCIEQGGTPETILNLVNAGADVNGHNANNSTALMVAAIASYYGDAIPPLLSQGARINDKDVDGNTALILAAFKGGLENVKKLADAGADANIVNNNGISALMGCQSSDQVKAIVEYLLSKGAKSELLAKDGTSALLIAVSYDAGVDLLQLLYNPALPMLKQTDEGLDVLGYALHNAVGKDVVAFLLSKGASAKVTYPDTSTPWLMAARFAKEAEVLDLLLKAGADTKAIDSNGSNALMQAVINPDPDILPFMLKQGYDVNAVGKDGFTPLMDCLADTSTVKVKLLLKAGANPDILSNEGGTALVYFLNKQLWDMTQVLIEQGAKLNYKVNDDFTPLLMAVSNEAPPALISLMLDKGADPGLVSKDGYTAYESAMNIYDQTTNAALLARLKPTPAGDE